MKKTSKKLPEFVRLADKAIRSAVQKTLAEHKLKQLPIFVWQENKVVRIPPERIHPR